MSDDRVETHVVIDDDASPGGRRAVHFQEYWVRLHAEPKAHEIVAVGADTATPGPGVLEAIATADLVLLPPSNPVVSIGTVLAVPGIREALATTPAPVVGLSPIIGGAPVRGMADRVLAAIGVETSAEAVALHYGAGATAACSTAGWSTDATPTAVASVEARRHRLPRRTAAHDRRAVGRGHGALGPGARRRAARPARVAVSGSLLVWAPDGLPEVAAGDDLATLLDGGARGRGLRARRRRRRRGDVQGRVQGRGPRGPGRPRGGDHAETVRVVARRGPTRIVETRHGLVLAAAGVDASNTDTGHRAAAARRPGRVGPRAAVPAAHRSPGSTWRSSSPTRWAARGAPG